MYSRAIKSEPDVNHPLGDGPKVFVSNSLHYKVRRVAYTS